ncbi:MAG: ABC transporter substrate-binding protein [Anaerolineae bacterium]|nr:ABC transporter substrate-binding protein [Anaerolineae bacterium]
MHRKILILVLMLAMLTACAPQATPQPTAPVTEQAPVAVITAPQVNLTDGCVAEGEFDPSLDYFPEKAVLTHTDGFSIKYYNNYKVITVNSPSPGASESMQYALVQCGTPAPQGFIAEQIIDVPVMTIATMSTTYLPFLDELGLLDRLVGLDDATSVSNPTVLQMAAEGKLAMLGYGAGINVEQALDLDPDLIMTYSSGSPEYDAHPVLIEAGLKVAVNAEWLDTSPLGRAEWGKFIAVFFNKEAEAEALFDQTVRQYDELTALTAGITDKPTVFANTGYQGTWSMPGGNSFAAAFMKDAGANYLWADDPATGSLPLSFETVFEQARDADFWLNIGFFATQNDLLAADARYADFAAFQSGSIWNNDAKTTATGGNDYYESAVAHPDVVLADLIKIFHPDLLPEHELVYYRLVQ